MNDKFLFDLDNGVKYLKCFLYGTLNFVAKIGEFKLISSLNRELFIGLSKSCEEIKVLTNELSKELLLIFIKVGKKEYLQEMLSIMDGA